MSVEERLGRIERALAELSALCLRVDPNRAYSDEQVCQLLGGVSRTTLWRLRRKGHLKTTPLLPADSEAGEGVNRTLGRQVAKFLEGRERATDEVHFTGTGRPRRAA